MTEKYKVLSGVFATSTILLLTMFVMVNNSATHEISELNGQLDYITRQLNNAENSLVLVCEQLKEKTLGWSYCQ